MRSVVAAKGVSNWHTTLDSIDVAKLFYPIIQIFENSSSMKLSQSYKIAPDVM